VCIRAKEIRKLQRGKNRRGEKDRSRRREPKGCLPIGERLLFPLLLALPEAPFQEQQQSVKVGMEGNETN